METSNYQLEKARDLFAHYTRCMQKPFTVHVELPEEIRYNFVPWLKQCVAELQTYKEHDLRKASLNCSGVCFAISMVIQGNGMDDIETEYESKVRAICRTYYTDVDKTYSNLGSYWFFNDVAMGVFFGNEKTYLENSKEMIDMWYDIRITFINKIIAEYEKES